MSLRGTLRKYTAEFLEGKRSLDECFVPEVSWAILRRVLLAEKMSRAATFEKRNPCRAEKKRAEARFWLSTGIKWSDIMKGV